MASQGVRPGPGAGVVDQLQELPREELVRIAVDDAKNWLAHDGLWFQAVEAAFGMEAAIAGSWTGSESRPAEASRRCSSA
jgi:hypothetical protein